MKITITMCRDKKCAFVCGLMISALLIVYSLPINAQNIPCTITLQKAVVLAQNMNHEAAIKSTMEGVITFINNLYQGDFHIEKEEYINIYFVRALMQEARKQFANIPNISFPDLPIEGVDICYKNSDIRMAYKGGKFRYDLRTVIKDDVIRIQQDENSDCAYDGEYTFIYFPNGFRVNGRKDGMIYPTKHITYKQAWYMLIPIDDTLPFSASIFKKTIKFDGVQSVDNIECIKISYVEDNELLRCGFLRNIIIA